MGGSVIVPPPSLKEAGVTQLVEYLVANEIVAGSSPVTRSIRP
jgi:hypothetical protein